MLLSGKHPKMCVLYTGHKPSHFVVILIQTRQIVVSCYHRKSSRIRYHVYVWPFTKPAGNICIVLYSTLRICIGESWLINYSNITYAMARKHDGCWKWVDFLWIVAVSTFNQPLNGSSNSDKRQASFSRNKSREIETQYYDALLFG